MVSLLAKCSRVAVLSSVACLIVSLLHTRHSIQAPGSSEEDSRRQEGPPPQRHQQQSCGCSCKPCRPPSANGGLMDPVIVVGGGLAGLSAANTVVQLGGRVLVLEKSTYMGGNSVKATSGINGAPTAPQAQLGIRDSAAAFEADTAASAAAGAPRAPATALQQVLANHSAAAVHWLMDEFALDLSQVAQLGGHSAPRTHRGRERFPGLAITYALMDRLEGLAAAGDAVRIVARARVTALLRDEATGAVGGVEYECERRQLHRVNGPVIVATGGFAADFSDSGILRRVRPDLAALPTTNGAHATGDGIRLAQHVGARTVDLDRVQVHPTGLVDPAEPGAKVKPLAAEALRGAGALLLNGAGQRFCDELGRRDYVTQRMRGARGPFRLVLNRRGAAALESHVRHYVSRGLMRRVPSGAALAAEMGVAPNELDATLRTYNAAAAGRLPDPHGKRFFHNAPFAMDEELVVAVVTPVLHYCMGGLEVRPSAEVVGAGGGVIGGLWAAGEVAGGVHGQNRLGGNSLLDCVVFGRIAGEAAARHLLRRALHVLRLSAQHVSQFAGHFADVADAAGDRGAGRARLAVDPEARWLAVNVSWPDRGRRARAAPRAAPPAAKSPAAGRAEGAARAGPADRAQAPLRSYTLAEVARHSTRKDCWVVVNGRVLDVTAFLPMHPGGVQSILIHAGSDVSVPFGMFHRLEMVDKYVPEAVVGVLAADARKRQGR